MGGAGSAVATAEQQAKKGVWERGREREREIKLLRGLETDRYRTWKIKSK